MTLWQKLIELNGGAPPEFLSTHPSAKARIRAVARYAERALPLYER